MTQRLVLSGDSHLSLLFSCLIVSLGFMGQTPTYSPWQANIETFPELSLWIARILSVLTWIALIALAKNKEEQLFTPRISTVMGTALLLGSALSLFASFSFELFVGGQCIVGISHTWVLACWAQRLSGFSNIQTNRCIILSSVIAVVVFTLFGILPSQIKAPVFLVILILSTIPLLCPLPHDQEEKACGVKNDCTSIRTTISALPIQLLALMASYTLLFRIMSQIEFPQSDETLSFFCGASIRIGGMVLLFVYFHKLHYQPTVRQTFIPLLVLTVIGVALLPVQDPVFSTVSVATVKASWTFFYTIIWIALFEIGRLQNKNILMVFLCGWTILNLFLLIAAPLSHMFRSQVNEGSLSIAGIALIFVYMLSVILLLFRSSHDKTSTDRVIPSAHEEPIHNNWKKAQSQFYFDLAYDHKLTNRETEVFELLVQGYSLPAIEEHFYLSHSTVKGHVRNIYRKFNVTNKQELIKLVGEQYKLAKQTDKQDA